MAEDIEYSSDRRLSAPAAERNKEPILEILRRVLPSSGLVLEIASGTGQHVAHFAQALPGLQWQPSDPDRANLESIRAWIGELANVSEPRELNVLVRPWSVERTDAVICSNMLHIAPWAATEALVAGSADIQRAGGVLFLYGPFRRFGRHTARSNEAFDSQLRARDPQWGVRDLEAVEVLARASGFALEEVVEMPANNLSLLLRKQAPA